MGVSSEPLTPFRWTPCRAGPVIAVSCLLALWAGACGGDGQGDRATGAKDMVTTAPSTTASTAASTQPSDATTTAPLDGQLNAASRLRLDGIGPVKIGMTPAEASRATGKRIQVGPDSGPHPASCGFASPRSGPKVSFMVIDGRIKRVDVEPPSPIATVSGVRIGSTEAEVHRVYRGGVRVEPHPYDPAGRYLVYESPQPSQRGLLLIFETDGFRVTSFRAGERSAVEAPEGCA